jgi:hypothetical protein
MLDRMLSDREHYDSVLTKITDDSQTIFAQQRAFAVMSDWQPAGLQKLTYRPLSILQRRMPQIRGTGRVNTSLSRRLSGVGEVKSGQATQVLRW